MIANDKSRSLEDPRSDSRDSSVVERRSAYESPRITRVGSLHELLAGGAGSAQEGGDPFLKKQTGAPG